MKSEFFQQCIAKLRDLGYQGPFYDIGHSTIEGIDKKCSDSVFFRFVEGDIHVYKFSHTET